MNRDEYHPHEDPWAGNTPLLRRRAVQIAVTLIAVGSFLLVTLLSTCAPRTRPAPTTSTTLPPAQIAAPVRLPAGPYL